MLRRIICPASGSEISICPEGDSKAVMYKYYNKVTTIEVDEYLFKEGTWVLNNNIELKEKVNFVHNGTEWLFDPTVTKSLASEDYLIFGKLGESE